MQCDPDNITADLVQHSVSTQAVGKHLESGVAKYGADELQCFLLYQGFSHK